MKSKGRSRWLLLANTTNSLQSNLPDNLRQAFSGSAVLEPCSSRFASVKAQDAYEVPLHCKIAGKGAGAVEHLIQVFFKRLDTLVVENNQVIFLYKRDGRWATVKIKV